MLVSKYMILKDLVIEASEKEVMDILLLQYQFSENDLLGYQEVLAKLKNMEPISSECQILIEHMVDCEGEGYEHVHGSIPGEEITRSLLFISHEEWLGMEITQSTLQNYSSAEIVAHCLYEMTFCGFSSSEVEESRLEMMDGGQWIAYEDICTKMDILLEKMDGNLSDDHPDVIELLSLSDQADRLYWELHPDLTAELPLNLDVELLVNLIRIAREQDLCLNELVNKCLDELVKSLDKDHSNHGHEA